MTPAGPFELFRKRHKDPPDVPPLINAKHADGAQQYGRTFSGIFRESWQGLLASIRTSDARSSLRHLLFHLPQGVKPRRVANVIQIVFRRFSLLVSVYFKAFGPNVIGAASSVSREIRALFRTPQIAG